MTIIRIIDGKEQKIQLTDEEIAKACEVWTIKSIIDDFNYILFELYNFEELTEDDYNYFMENPDFIEDIARDFNNKYINGYTMEDISNELERYI